nr:hypothetical protein [uncultured bacterium]
MIKTNDREFHCHSLQNSSSRSIPQTRKRKNISSGKFMLHLRVAHKPSQNDPVRAIHPPHFLFQAIRERPVSHDA